MTFKDSVLPPVDNGLVADFENFGGFFGCECVVGHVPNVPNKVLAVKVFISGSSIRRRTGKGMWHFAPRLCPGFRLGLGINRWLEPAAEPTPSTQTKSTANKSPCPRATK